VIISPPQVSLTPIVSIPTYGDKETTTRSAPFTAVNGLNQPSQGPRVDSGNRTWLKEEVTMETRGPLPDTALSGSADSWRRGDYSAPQTPTMRTQGRRSDRYPRRPNSRTPATQTTRKEAHSLA
jgi:hypothetical protein